MENKINIAELLKDCPEGMDLDCAMYDNVQFDIVQDGNAFPIKINTPEGRISLSKYGCYSLNPQCKCVIFPKGRTTWEGFVPPCKFKDGDILTKDRVSICIYKGPMYYNNNLADFYCGYRITDRALVLKGKNDHFGDIDVYRLATEEEKARLFQAIKDNGYKWNAETKTLDKLIEPSFKVGDKVRHKNNHGVVFTITSIEEDSYVCGAKAAFWFDDQDDYELVPNKFDITTLIPFESRVLVRDYNNDNWKASFWGCLTGSEYGFKYDTVRGLYRQCIPYENNEHLLGKRDDCVDFYKTWE